MKITEEWLTQKNACRISLDYVCKNKYIGLQTEAFIRKLIDEKRFSDVNWLITKILDKKGNVKYAIYAAKQVLPIFENKYPENNKPRLAIKAAENYLKNPCEETTNAAIANAVAAANANAAAAAHTAAAAAAHANAAYATNAAAYAAVNAAYAAYAVAAHAAYYAAYAAAADAAAYYAAYAAAADAAHAAHATAATATYATADYTIVRTKIIEYGIELIKNKNKIV